MNGQAWTTAEPFGNMDATEQNFGDFVDFDNLDLDLSEFNYNGAAPLADIPSALHDFPTQVAQLPQHHHNGANGGQQPQGNMGGHSANGFTFDYSLGQFSQAGTPAFQAQDHIFRPHNGVPPTPNSIEMHGDPHRYMRQMDSQQALFDQRYHMRKDDTIPDFTMPGAYFSPLTSPALNAQNQQHAHQHSHATPSGSSTGHSPVDVDMDMLSEPAMMQQETGRRLRSTNKRNAPRSANANGRVRQSPIVKPGRRKATVSSFIPPKEVTELMQEARGGRPSSSSLDVPHSRDGSETDSISPEPMLSDMPPPPKPTSLTQSPAMMAQMNGQGSATPATPASLMRIHPSPNFSDSLEAPPMMEDLTLPEASLERPALDRLDTVIYDGDQDTPRGTDNTHALLLASKSNYQNILDGTTVPGVVYPTSLSTNLTSKRTSHKIAEQGRRNRINMALQEMQALLPSTLVAATDAKSPESSAAQSSNSKAAKVESAIDYIKQLKQEVSEKDRMLESKDQEMEQLRKELAALRRSSSVGSAAEIASQLKSEPVSTPSTDNGSGT
ncbi:hypothetical protein SNOG_00287 [Parastagonospora nodorum SN15]|uniref:BHLH domain-containing protein n=1 Tax=Phaeosphaeria nodorum (strain SN15 / ATCC MYA-4574 / FGSC 10173) TaxID=321614 RepID=Q0V6S7_PHANO|nr:hypothetical protein SNOG_00287 [Parastagonospora nodorum SN15]EAT91782.2 hypothetical protein SNOG_00287 [Parastagonospora nodorum SN15]